MSYKKIFNIFGGFSGVHKELHFLEKSPQVVQVVVEDYDDGLTILAYPMEREYVAELHRALGEWLGMNDIGKPVSDVLELKKIRRKGGKITDSDGDVFVGTDYGWMNLMFPEKYFSDDQVWSWNSNPTIIELGDNG